MYLRTSFLVSDKLSEVKKNRSGVKKKDNIEEEGVKKLPNLDYGNE
jgi:hypothetical protein